MTTLATLKGYGVPSEYLQGVIGQNYVDLDTGIEYICEREAGYINVGGNDFTHRLVWKKVSGEGLTEKLYSDTLTWDGEGIYEMESMMGMYKVSSLVPYEECFDLGGSWFEISVEGGVLRRVDITDECIVREGNVICLGPANGTPVIYIIKDETYMPDLDKTVTKGIYFKGPLNDPLYVSSFRINGFNKFYTGEKIKEEYLPSNASGGGEQYIRITHDEEMGSFKCNMTYEEVYSLCFNEQNLPPMGVCMYDNNNLLHLYSYGNRSTASPIGYIALEFKSVMNDDAAYLYYRTDGLLTDVEPGGK